MQHHQIIAAMLLVFDIATWQCGGIVLNGIEGGRMTGGNVVGVIIADSCIAFIIIVAVVIIAAFTVVVGVDGRVAPSILLHLLLDSISALIIEY